jgi:hypothetical protein
MDQLILFPKSNTKSDECEDESPHPQTKHALVSDPDPIRLDHIQS